MGQDQDANKQITNPREKNEIYGEVESRVQTMSQQVKQDIAEAWKVVHSIFSHGGWSVNKPSSKCTAELYYSLESALLPAYFLASLCNLQNSALCSCIFKAGLCLEQNESTSETRRLSVGAGRESWVFVESVPAAFGILTAPSGLSSLEALGSTSSSSSCPQKMSQKGS